MMTSAGSLSRAAARIAAATRSYSSTATAPWSLYPPRRIDDDDRPLPLRRRSAPRMVDRVVRPTRMSTATTRTIHESATARGSASSSSVLPPSADSDSDEDENVYDDDGVGASIPFLLADIGEGIAEVELLQWFVSPGDRVRQFDRVCEVQSDKASVEITSRYDGVVTELCGNVGDVMRVGRPLLRVATTTAAAAAAATTAAGEGGDVVRERGGTETMTTSSSSSSSGATTTTTTTLHNVDDESDRLSIPLVGSDYSRYYEGGGRGGVDAVAPRADMLGGTFVPRGGGGGGGGGGRGGANATIHARVLTSPAVRRLGRENGIDLGTVMGTGPGGRVLKADVLRIIDPAAASSVAASSSSSTSAPPSPITTSATNAASPRLAAGGGPGTTTTTTANGDSVVPIRGYHRLMVKTMTSSLRVPHMVYSDEVNVNALTEVRDSLRPLYANHARGDDRQHPERKLTYMPFFVKAASLALSAYPALNSTIDVEGMTLTYHGEHRIGIAVDTPRGLAVPVIGGCQDRSVLEIAEELNRLYSLRLPRFVDDDSDVVESVRIMPISWGGDHRAVDGATMARFSNLWKSYCENPSSMMFAMR
ncbi:hypothetical protein ACHAW5_010942 [Stephanodiscus triporus]|uniref:Dihydrolipoamide acetyltransferase component of pyruvate dehydrogenase complex n=1 Tax=Stephanodiscus triporus TaxID=2934178 RepID=A0ABD3Q2J5_9STRA